MFARLNNRLLRLRRRFSRSQWATRFLGLPRSQNTACDSGLILLQIDGLAFEQFKKAIERGRMPFLRRLMRREEYELCRFYSGLPSSTPAVQGELFYGVRSVVPSFRFFDVSTGRVLSMLDAESVRIIESRLMKKGEGLLKGGSAYADIYEGGADSAHFCPDALGFDRLFRSRYRLAVMATILIYFPSILRIVYLLGIEFGLAIWDFFVGIGRRTDIFRELQFVPTRVAICILLRELVTFGVRVDAARGVPIIHANFLGYDEQSHRRGPSSAFAHWTLKGIDRCLKQIWLAARRSSLRSYEVWIYSDHGQELSAYYSRYTGYILYEKVAEILARNGLLDKAVLGSVNGEELKRASWLGWGFQWMHMEKMKPSVGTVRGLQVPAVGPLGHLYLSGSISNDRIVQLACEIVDDGCIPLIFAQLSNGEICGWNSSGQWKLPEDAGRLLGEDHPFLEEAAESLCELLGDRNSGTLLLSGWNPQGQSLTFAPETGSHAGPGPSETCGFALLPGDAPITLRKGKYIRAIDLADAARRLLGGIEPAADAEYESQSESPQGERNTKSPGLAGSRGFGKALQSNTTRGSGVKSPYLRVMTYNVHSCLGMDGRLSPNRIARVIGRYCPDIVMLQEVDVNYGRSGGVNQAYAIAHELEMEFHFHPAYQIEGEQYGDAILSDLPMRIIRLGSLPSFAGLEPRGAIWVGVQYRGREVQLLNTHIGLRRFERTAQLDALLGPDWLGSLDCRNPTVLCGDFNTLPNSANYRKLAGRLRDVQTSLENHRLRGTLLGFWRIDHVFVSEDVKVVGINVPRNSLTRSASDHLPLIVDLDLAG